MSKIRPIQPAQLAAPAPFVGVDRCERVSTRTRRSGSTSTAATPGPATTSTNIELTVTQAPLVVGAGLQSNQPK
jgi:hypothetical protein